MSTESQRESWACAILRYLREVDPPGMAEFALRREERDGFALAWMQARGIDALDRVCLFALLQKA